MAGHGGPDRSAVAHRMDEGAKTAGALSEHSPSTVSAASELLFHTRQHLANQETLPISGGGAIDILVAAEPREAIREGYDGRQHRTGADQPIETFGNVL